ncbi:MAG: glucose-1-phosphate thymidylyltransferase RfbA [Flavobacteriales bacterium]|jgi:glucose-1-phosphate thymidylyltransferase|tara:strand:- start:7839 stop:8711 length:873 start_codon:yes stop_codon:yes gene_type:complete
MKGIILAGGSGTRLYPITKGTSKQLLSIYDKPMVYYPLSVLMLSGIKEILIISTPQDLPNFRKLLGSGAEFGLSFEYKEQPSPDGLAQAFILGEEFIGKDDVCLVLGDNIFYGPGFSKLLKKSVESTANDKKATVFGYYVTDPENFGVVEFDDKNKAISIEEKPISPKSNYAVVGLYYYPNNVIQISKSIMPSKRGELEISSINEEYLKKGILNVEILGRGFAWLDTGTHDSLLEASNYIHAIEKHSGLKVACIEEIAYKMGYIDADQLKILIEPLKKTGYGKYLKNKVL